MVTTCHITIRPFDVTGQIAYQSHLNSRKLTYTYTHFHRTRGQATNCHPHKYKYLNKNQVGNQSLKL